MSELKRRSMLNRCPACGANPGEDCVEVGSERTANWPPRDWVQGVNWHDRRIGAGRAQ